MINSANLRDDLDVVTSVYLPESKLNVVYKEIPTTMFNLFSIEYDSLPVI